MKNVLIVSLLVFFAVCSFGQNPYTELSWPWLKQADIQKMNVKSILLATMDSDNKTVVRQIKLSFNNDGLLISEEGQVGFRYKSVFVYSVNGTLESMVNSDDITSDTTFYRVIPEKKMVVKQSIRKSGPDMFAVSETHYSYNDVGQLAKIIDYSGDLATVDRPGNNNLNIDALTSVTIQDTKMTIKGPAVTQNLTFDSHGKLLLSEAYNSEYDLSEIYEYNYDQTGKLVLIFWEQNGTSSKTFVTFEYYE